MRDEFRGNFTRDTTDHRKQFSRVLFKQGKVLLDSDFNEQQDIVTHYLRTLTRDLIGSHGGPGNGFRIVNHYKDYDEKGLPVAFEGEKHPVVRDLAICPGHYYVDGILCENPGEYRKKGVPLPKSYKDQEGYPFPGSLDLTKQNIPKGKHLVYLDVWERTISHLQDDSIREKALGGVDTAVRSKVVWQVRTFPLPEDQDDKEDKDDFDIIANIVNELFDILFGDEDHGGEGHGDEKPDWDGLTPCRNRNRGRLKARIRESKEGVSTDPCTISPETGSKIVENCLYRVEIHRPGKAADNASFKLSRMNGSNDLPVRKVTLSTEPESDIAVVELKELREGQQSELKKGNWVEILDDNYIIRFDALPLWQVDSISGDSAIVTLKRPRSTADRKDVFEKNPILRIWDHTGDLNPETGGVRLYEGAVLIEEDKWLDADNVIQVLFQPGGVYRTGDYWLIPARVETGNIEWPKGDDNKPIARPPHGIEHHCAPLAVIYINVDGKVSIRRDCRRTFDHIAVGHGRSERHE